jgi:radical SAM-linked protein
MALLSHLDLMRMLERALRRSALPISYTGGFHPLPRIQIALALPLGAEADGEWMDLEFTSSVTGEHLLRTLQTLLPDGLTLLSAEEVPVSGKSLSQNITGAVWSFELQLESEAHPCWSEAVEALMAAEQLIWHDTDKKGRPRERDCRPALRQLMLVSPSDGPRVRLQLEATVDPMGRSIRPSQIKHWLEAQLGSTLQLHALRREALQLAGC